MWAVHGRFLMRHTVCKGGQEWCHFSGEKADGFYPTSDLRWCQQAEVPWTTRCLDSCGLPPQTYKPRLATAKENSLRGVCEERGERSSTPVRVFKPRKIITTKRSLGRQDVVSGRDPDQKKNIRAKHGLLLVRPCHFWSLEGESGNVVYRNSIAFIIFLQI